MPLGQSFAAWPARAGQQMPWQSSLDRAETRVTKSGGVAKRASSKNIVCRRAGMVRELGPQRVRRGECQLYSGRKKNCLMPGAAGGRALQIPKWSFARL